MREMFWIGFSGHNNLVQKTRYVKCKETGGELTPKRAKLEWKKSHPPLLLHIQNVTLSQIFTAPFTIHKQARVSLGPIKKRMEKEKN